jgi:hypothetical protein
MRPTMMMQLFNNTSNLMQNADAKIKSHPFFRAVIEAHPPTGRGDGLDPLDKMPAAPHAVGETDLNDSPLTGRGCVLLVLMMMMMMMY